MTERENERAAGDRIEGLAGAYVVRAKHGEGAFGITWRVDDAASGVPYVLKELRLDRLGEWKALELFEREGRTLEGLNHAGIPRYRDFFAHDGERAFPVSALTAYEGTGKIALLLVQQFVEGQTIDARVQRGASFAPAELERILRDLLDVLEYLHGLAPPVIHRDISPRNVILDREGRAHLVDFGAIQDRIRAAGTVGSTTVGTMGFAPLEQMRGDARPSSDLYALGMTLLYAASGLGPDAMAVDEDTGKVKVAEVAPTLSVRVRATLDAMVEPIASKRVASATAALALLRQSPAPIRRPSAKLPLFVAMGAVAMAVATSGIFLLAARPKAAPPPPQSATDPPTAVRPSPVVRPTSTPAATTAAPVVEPVKLTWHPRVVDATGMAVKPGARCTLTALVTPGPRIGRVRLVCSELVLYDSAVPLNGQSMLDTDLGEEPQGEQRRGWIAYSDVGPRTSRAQARIDTRAGKIQAFEDGLSEYRVNLKIDKLSEPYPDAKLVPERAAPK
jgi:serine/threonine protein kinase